MQTVQCLLEVVSMFPRVVTVEVTVVRTILAIVVVLLPCLLEVQTIITISCITNSSSNNIISHHITKLTLPLVAVEEWTLAEIIARTVTQVRDHNLTDGVSREKSKESLLQVRIYVYLSICTRQCIFLTCFYPRNTAACWGVQQSWSRYF